MLLPNYEYFLRIVEYKSISKAAESLYISQPSLTKYLQKLESELNIQLFDRKQTPMKLTDAGLYFFDYVKRVEREEHDLLTRVSEIKNAGRATLTIGMALWRSSVILPEFLPIFFERHPMISIRLQEGSAATLESALMNDDVDFCVMNLPVNYTNVSYEPIIDEYIFLIGSHRFPLVQQLEEELAADPYRRTDIRRFADQPFILTQPGQHITEYVNSMLSRHNVELRCLMRTSNVTTAVNLAASGIGFTFVPELGTHSRFFPSQDVSLFIVNTPPLRCTLAAVYKKSSYLSAAAQLFIQELQQFSHQRRSDAI